MLTMHKSLDFNCKIATGRDNSAALHTGLESQNRQKLTTYIFSPAKKKKNHLHILLLLCEDAPAPAICQRKELSLA